MSGSHHKRFGLKTRRAHEQVFSIETFFLKHVTRERAASRLQERIDVTGRKPGGGDDVAEVVGLETQTWYSPGQIPVATHSRLLERPALTRSCGR